MYAKDPAPLKVKEVWVKERRYVVCLNEEERRKDAHDREAILAHLKEQLRSGDKSLVGNKGYRRYLRVEGSGHFAIDEKQVKAEQRYDGIWVLRTNTDYNAETVAHVYEMGSRGYFPYNQINPCLSTTNAMRQFEATCFAVSWPCC